ncbi:MAG: glycosyltransferase N-terminal domain-containing protein [Phycisphaerales bacterium]|nr:glycosyltransferase [Planctomycetota bacterium]
MNAFDLLYLTGGALASPWLLRKQRKGWKERFGHVAGLPAKTRARLMVHAVSVGEVNALRHLVPLLAGGSESEFDLVITAGTDTGLARAQELFSKHAIVLRYPLDFSASVKRFLDAVRPDAVGLVELEVWPNFIRECEKRGVPVGVINGRLSERSFRGYRKVRGVLGRTFGRLAFAAAQDESYAERFCAMGVPPERVSVTGTMKWDAAVVPDDPSTLVPGAAELAAEMGIDRQRPLIVAGSTGPGEEEMLKLACPEGTQLLCAPRKPERFDEAARALEGCVRRSMVKGKGARTPGGRYFLLDTIGELRMAYSLASVTVVGRSFIDLFGSDPIEPAALGKPVVIGPRVSDFQQTVETFEKAVAIRKVDPAELGRVLADLLSDGAERARLGEAARRTVLENKGASARHADLLREMVQKAVRNASTGH